MNKARKLDELVTSVEDLLAKLPKDATPQICALRDKVDAGIEQTWNAVERESADARLTAHRALKSVGRVGTHPYAIVGFLMLAGLLFANRPR